MNQEFVKLEGLGNDFVLIDQRHTDRQLTDSQIKKIGERRFGIGCDQILILKAPTNDDADFSYYVFNSDGSKSEHCGNGLRCAGAYFKKFHNVKNSVIAQIGMSTYEVKFLDNGLFAVDIDTPNFDPEKVGLGKIDPIDRYTTIIKDKPIEYGAVSLGNPHAVINVEEPVREVASIIGPQFQEKGIFRDGVNVGFFRVVDRSTIELSVWERGIGYTLACGTGACAAVAVGQKWGLLDHKVEVIQEGGVLDIIADKIGGQLKMIGPANFVFDGSIEV